MSFLRAVYRLIGLIGVQVAFAMVALTLYQRYKNNRVAGMPRAVHYTGMWGRACCRWFNFKIRIKGARPPEGAALVVANHIGSPDIFVLAAAIPGFFVAKNEVRYWPLVGRMADIGGTVYIDRDRRQSAGGLLSGMQERLQAGYRVIVFPEGRATDGQSLHPFKSPAFEGPIRAQCPVLPVVIQYHDGNRPSVACWHQSSFMGHLWQLLRHRELQVTLHTLPLLTGHNKRRDLARVTHESMEAVFGKTRDTGSECRDADI